MEPHHASRDPGSDAPQRRRRLDEGVLGPDWLTDQALRSLARREASEHGIAGWLERKIHQRCARTGEEPDAGLACLGAVVQQLVDRGYVDDRRFATQLVTRLRREGRSRAGVQGRLERAGIPESIADELIRQHDGSAELEAAWRLAKKRRIGPYCLDPERRAASRERHLGVLARQGFEREVAVRVIDADEPMEID